MYDNHSSLLYMYVTVSEKRDLFMLNDSYMYMHVTTLIVTRALGLMLKVGGKFTVSVVYWRKTNHVSLVSSL